MAPYCIQFKEHLIYSKKVFWSSIGTLLLSTFPPIPRKGGTIVGLNDFKKPKRAGNFANPLLSFIMCFAGESDPESAVLPLDDPRIMWYKTQDSGVRFRKHSTRRFNGQADKYYSIYYNINRG